MLTDLGKLHIKRYMAGFVPGIAQSIAIGVGQKAEAATDTKMHFEVGRSNVTLISYDFVNNRLIFKAEVPDEFAGAVYEVALFSAPSNAVAGEFGSRLLTTFDSGTEEWIDATSGVDATFSTTNARVGLDSLRHTPAASATKTDALRDMVLDLGGYSAADKFVMAMNIGNANTASVKLRLLTDTSNYYEVSFGAPTAGYKIVEANKGSATAVGTPDWSSITEMRIITTSNAGGSSSVDYDALRIEDTDTVNSDYIMISREILSGAFIKQEGQTKEIEFALNINIT